LDAVIQLRRKSPRSQTSTALIFASDVVHAGRRWRHVPRGRRAELGTETTNANGYIQVKTERGWLGKHTLILEEQLGRQLQSDERAMFKDGNRTNFDPDNIVLAGGSNYSIRKRIAKLEAEIADRLALLNELKASLDE